MSFIRVVGHMLVFSMCVQADDGECSDCSGSTNSPISLLQASVNKHTLSDAAVVGHTNSQQRQHSSMTTSGSNKTVSSCDWNPQAVQDLSDKYPEIFAEAQQNRNAASHLWAHFIIQRSECLSHQQIVHMFGGFCAVSGSPLDEPSPDTRYKLELALTGGGTKLGYSYHCCWPCFCDEKDFIKVDTKTLKDKNGEEKQYFFEVIGNPCKDSPPVCEVAEAEGCIPIEAPGVKCHNGELKHAILSDGGHPIIGMFFVDDAGLKDSISGDDEKMQTEDGSLISVNKACSERKKSGMESGMGTIFVNVAKLNPL